MLSLTGYWNSKVMQCGILLNLFYYSIGYVNSLPTMQLSLVFPEILTQNITHCHWQSVPGNSRLMYCGILINMPYVCMYVFYFTFCIMIMMYQDDKNECGLGGIVKTAHVKRKKKNCYFSFECDI